MEQGIPKLARISWPRGELGKSSGQLETVWLWPWAWDALSPDATVPARSKANEQK